MVGGLSAGGVALAMSSLLVAVHALLLPGGHWMADEFLVAETDARNGWRSVLGRFWFWSPRPAAELLGTPYLLLAHALQRPLAAPFLCALWVGTAAGVAWAARLAGERHPWRLSVLLFALLLCLSRPDQMFFWPLATVAYLPCWAGLAVAAMLLRSDREFPRLLPAALLLAAFSAEVGAATVLLGIALMMLPGMAGRTGFRSAIREERWMMLAAAGALGICVLVATARVSTMSEIFDRGSGLGGSWPRSLLASVPAFAAALPAVPGMPWWAGAAAKTALLFGLPAPDAEPRRRRRLFAWGLALLGGAWLSVLLALHQFGALCCSRHASLRQGMILLALLCFAALLPRKGRPVGSPRGREARLWLVPLVLAVLLCGRLPVVAGDLHRLPAFLRAREAEWRSGRSAGDAMMLRVGPGGRLFGGPDWKPGSLVRANGGEPGFGLDGIAAFFNKRRIEARPVP
ncbi:hypothetical protein [Rhizosaccharibacter radicis]|uniref:Glycosyltransferase RgtA/B/C/D-like domain-containing protein n=1 Tax=Rhizosaccharibacter radicis TaxID=2782605 RepID=A0ABT1VVX3_9PROT|nr:hypothetical protein [Acetobacteraceae bacterium KSS12]